MIASLSIAGTLSGKDFHGRLETSADSPLVAFNIIDCRPPQPERNRPYELPGLENLSAPLLNCLLPRLMRSST